MTSTAQEQHTVPGWAPVSSMLICLLGLLDAAYLSYEHYTSSATLACSETGAINCLKVTTSSYATVLGVPVAVLGLVFFAVMTVLSLPGLWRHPSPSVHRLRLVAATAGLLTVLYLLWVELFQLDAICLWCTGIHVLTFALFGVVVVATALSPQDSSRTP